MSRFVIMPRPLPGIVVGWMPLIVTFCVDVAHVIRVSWGDGSFFW